MGSWGALGGGYHTAHGGGMGGAIAKTASCCRLARKDKAVKLEVERAPVGGAVQMKESGGGELAVVF